MRRGADIERAGTRVSVPALPLVAQHHGTTSTSRRVAWDVDCVFES